MTTLAHPVLSQRSDRLIGLDLARCLAFAGMVVVNFSLLFGVDNGSAGVAGWVITMFEGRASATFVILAGLGVALMSHQGQKAGIGPIIMRRALVLMGLGLLNSLIFPADILHYYAVYFLLALPFLRAPRWGLMLVILLVNLMSLIALIFWNYQTNWNWTTLTYNGFWQPSGFVRNLFLNGFHPVLPWVSFFFFGLLLGRLPLQSIRVQWALAMGGLVGFALAAVLSSWFVTEPPWSSPLFSALGGLSPIPPGPVYVLNGLATGAMVIGCCLLVCPTSAEQGEGLEGTRGVLRRVFSILASAGRMSLTLYLGHILIGMMIFVAVGFENSTHALESLVASLCWIMLSVVFAWRWMKHFRLGPLEMLLRRIAG